MSVIACSKCGTKNRVDPGRAFARSRRSAASVEAALDLSKGRRKGRGNKAAGCV